MSIEPIPVEDLKIKHLLENLPIIINFNDIIIIAKRCTRIIEDRYWIIPQHSHDSYEFHYVISGRGQIEVENNSFKVSEGDFYITAPFVRHKQISSKHSVLKEFGIECKIILPDNGKNKAEDKEISFFKDITSKTYYSRFTEKTNLKRDIEILEKTAAEKKFGYWIKLESLILTIVIEFLSTAYHYYESSEYRGLGSLNEQRLTKISNYIEDNLSKDITIENVAKEFYLSTRQINRILTKEYGSSFHKYLTSVRCETAVKLLKESDLSVSEISSRVGFGNYLQMFRGLKNAGYPSPTKIKSKEN